MSDLICQVELNAVKTCTEPASMTATFGCIHEHITTKPMCLNHLLALGGERVLCLKCWNATHEVQWVQAIELADERTNPCVPAT